MADYIRRDIVLKIINTVNDTGGFAGYADYCVLFDEINTMPASDVQPIRHGRWENEYLDDDDDVWCADCTNCNNETHSRFGRVSKIYAYCPNCGADMRGDTNG